MAVSNAERQRRYINRLKADQAEARALRALTAEQTPSKPADWSDDDADMAHTILTNLDIRRGRTADGRHLRALADLIERAAPHLIDAARRRAAEIEAPAPSRRRGEVTKM